jgi:hypothetical protein
MEPARDTAYLLQVQTNVSERALESLSTYPEPHDNVISRDIERFLEFRESDRAALASASASHIFIIASPSAFPRARESGTGTAFPICRSCCT